MRHPLDAVLVEALRPGTVYAVGGRVRDELRALDGGTGWAPKDLDYVVTGLPFDEVVGHLGSHGRVDVVGASFAVIKFQHAAGSADVALPRREYSTGSGHRDFSIVSGPEISIEDDLGRRDFRMNMVARRLEDDAIVDPYGGVRDIAHRTIDIVAEQTFHEDPLRLLRAAQFAARFGFDVTERTRRAMTAAAGSVTTVSPERVGEELTKLVRFAPAPSIGFELMRETSVLEHIWPELLEGVGVDQNEWHAYDVYHHSLATIDATSVDDVTLRLAALLHDVGKPRTKDGPHFYRHEHVGAELVPAMLARLRLPNAVIDRVARLVRHHMYGADPELQPKAIRRFIHRVGAENLEHLFALRAADIIGSGLPKRDDANERFEAAVLSVLHERPAASVKDLAIGGREIIALLEAAGKVPANFTGDRRVGDILAALFERVIDDPALNERTTLIEAAQALVSALPGGSNARSPQASSETEAARRSRPPSRCADR